MNDNERLRMIWNTNSTLSQREFARRYGLGTGQMVNQYLLGRRPLNLPAAVKFAQGLGVALEAISPSIAESAKRASEMTGKDFAPRAPTGRAIPLVGLVRAGLPTSPGDLVYDDCIVTDRDGDDLFALRVSGDSMSPDLSDGDVVIVDPHIHPRPGDIVIARVDNEDAATIKRYALRGVDDYGRDRFDLIPSNDLYPTLHSSDRPVQICGVVVEHRIFRR